MAAQTVDDVLALQQACQADATGVLLDLTAGGWGLLSITGEDRLRFLHNQLTNSFTDATPGQVLQSSYTSSLGRAIDLVSAFVLEDEVLLLASPNRHEQLLAAFNKYIFPLDRVKVEKKEMHGLFTWLGSAAAAAATVPQLLGETTALPDPDQCRLASPSSSILVAEGTGLALPGFTLLALEGGQSLATAAQAHNVRVGGPADWEALRIWQGRPYPGKELTLDVTPLEAGLYCMVGFEKGCYLGQETLAKQANNKGERQRLFGVTAAAATGGLVEKARLVDADGQRAGVVTSSFSAKGELGLAFVRKTVPDPLTTPLFLEGDNATKIPVQIRDIPFATRTAAVVAPTSSKAPGGSEDTAAAASQAAAAAEKAAEAERKAAKCAVLMRSSFTTRRREALGYRGPGSALCRPSSTCFLVVVVGVWVAAIVFFGTAVFGHGKGDAASYAFSFLGRGLHTQTAEKPLSEVQLLQREVDELEARLTGLDKQRDAVPRPPLELKHAAEAEAEAAAAKAKKEQQKPAAEAGGQKKTEPKQEGNAASATLDSDTSPLPLVDPTVLTRSKPPFEHADMEGLCAHKNDGDEDILKRVHVWPDAQMGEPRILCFSYTLSSAHATAVKNVRMTWGQRCDGYLAMSDLLDPAVPSIDIKHKGPEAYENMWQKIRSIWVYLHKHHLHDYDYFVSGGDDLFLIIENLRRYLLSEEIVAATEHGKKPIFLGRAFRPPGDPITFNSGGAGFVLNAAALEVLAKELHGQGKSGEPCRPNQVGFWEDVNVAYCLHQGGVKVYNSTQDPLGRERFLPFTPGNHLYYQVPKNPDWYAKYTFNLKIGKECCSKEAISFHYVKGDLMKRYHAIVHGMCPNLKPLKPGMAAVDSR